jgi:hypothetical protein
MPEVRFGLSVDVAAQIRMQVDLSRRRLVREVEMLFGDGSFRGSNLQTKLQTNHAAR